MKGTIILEVTCRVGLEGLLQETDQLRGRCTLD